MCPQERQVYSRQTSPVNVFLSVWNSSPPHLGQLSLGVDLVMRGLTSAFCRTVLSAKRRIGGVGQQRAVRPLRYDQDGSPPYASMSVHRALLIEPQQSAQ